MKYVNPGDLVSVASVDVDLESVDAEMLELLRLCAVLKAGKIGIEPFIEMIELNHGPLPDIGGHDGED